MSVSKNELPAFSGPKTISQGLYPVFGLTVVFSIFATKNGKNSQFKVGWVANIFLIIIFTVPTNLSTCPLPAGCKAAEAITFIPNADMSSSQPCPRKAGPLSLCNLCTLKFCNTPYSITLDISCEVLLFKGCKITKSENTHCITKM